MDTFFIVGNLKVYPFILADAPVPGFTVLSWNAYTVGSLWLLKDLNEVCYRDEGNARVHGQVWRAHEEESIKLLEKYSGKEAGLTDYKKVIVDLPNEDCRIQTVAFKLKEIKPDYEKLDCGKWRF